MEMDWSWAFCLCEVQYDPNTPLTFACNASEFGIGVVIQHTMPNGQERPIAYASQTLSPAEKIFSADREGRTDLLYKDIPPVFVG